MTRDELLLKYLELEWYDHIQTRSQTWRTLEIEAALVVAMIGIDWQIAATWATVVAALAVTLGGVSGALITKHHRNTESRKFENIIRLEEELEGSVGAPFYTGASWVKCPAPLRWRDLINPKVVCTPMFILRMHVMMIVFGSIYGAAKLVVR